MHGEDLTNMFKTVPQSVLPSDYGGNAPPCKELHGTPGSAPRTTPPFSHCRRAF